jgi:hypothetical protein
LGSVVPALFLSLCIALIVVSGRDEAPMIVMFASLFAVPAVILLNGWVLFVDWQRRSRLVASASVLPTMIIIGSVLFVHGAGRWRDAGLLILLPFQIVPMQSLGTLTVLWAIGIAGLLFTAWRIAARSEPR